MSRKHGRSSHYVIFKIESENGVMHSSCFVISETQGENQDIPFWNSETCVTRGCWKLQYWKAKLLYKWGAKVLAHSETINATASHLNVVSQSSFALDVNVGCLIMSCNRDVCVLTWHTWIINIWITSHCISNSKV